MSKQISNHNLFATVFITGAAVLVIEVTAVRILSPFYGSSLYVLSSVLTVILAALSVGYWYGGRRADKEQSVDSLYSIISISGLFVIGLLLLSKFLLPALGSHLPYTAGPLIFSMGLFFIPAFLLGIVSPYVIKIQSLTNPIEKIGSVVGSTFFWGTAGSILGSLATGFVFIPVIGVTKTILLVGISLVALGILMPLFSGLPIAKTKTFTVLILSIILSASLFVIDQNTNQSLVYSSEGLYSSIRIQDGFFNQKPVRILLRDTNNSSVIYFDSKKLVSTYSKFALLYQSLIENPKEVLVLGGGAYTIPRTLASIDPELHIDVVEIEPILFDLSREYFDLSDVSRITNYPMDARVFLNQPRDKKYDLIFGDLFATNLAAPFHLSTNEFYNLVAENLSDDGVFILNIVGIPENSQPSLSGSVAKTLEANFTNVTAFALGDNLEERQNIIFITKKNNIEIEANFWEFNRLGLNAVEFDFSEMRLKNEILLTDDHSPIEYLASKES